MKNWWLEEALVLTAFCAIIASAIIGLLIGIGEGVIR